MKARKHKDSCPPFVLVAIYQHLDPAQLLFSPRSLHRVFRWSMTPWRDCQVATLRSLATLAESAYPRSVWTWILSSPFEIPRPVPSGHLLLLSIHSCNPLRWTACTVPSLSLSCHRSSETLCGKCSVQAQRLRGTH